MRRIVIISALLIGFTVAAPAAIAKPPVGGCPTSEWELRASPPPDSTGVASTDQNGDGLSCYLEAPEGGGIYTVVDNPVKHR